MYVGGIALVKIGVKINSSTKENYIRQIKKFVDYFEVCVDLNVKCDDNCLLNFDLPVSTIHVASFYSGVNFSNSSRKKVNLLALQTAFKYADHYKSKKIIFHPEVIENNLCSVSNLIRFLKTNYDSRLIVENMPFSSGYFEHLCRNHEEIAKVIMKAKVGFCLDFAHASEYAMRTGVNSEELINRLFLLNPVHFHLTDTKLNKVFDQNYNETHLNFGMGDVNIRLIKGKINKNAEVTIETPQNIKKQIKEIKYLKY